MDFFPLHEVLNQLTSEPGTTDITFTSRGEVGVRQNMRMAVQTMEPVRLLWPGTVEHFFPNRPQDRRVGQTIMLVDGPRRYRATLTMEEGGEAIAIRPLPLRIRTAKELRLPEFLVPYVLGLKGGMFLIGGVTGSGKSSTLASLVNAFCEGAGGTVVTLEKPIEVLHAGNEKTIVHQREVGRDVVSYADGLHEAMHQNPDWIVVQEIRHPAEAETALAAALSGHLVLASIHAFTAATTPQRYLSIINPTMEDVGARDALASCLEGVLLQRLVEGYEGLVPVFEIMLMRNIERRMERINAMENDLRLGNWVALRQDTEASKRLGMCLWQDSLQERIDAGLIPAP